MTSFFFNVQNRNSITVEKTQDLKSKADRAETASVKFVAKAGSDNVCEGLPNGVVGGI